MAATSPQEPVQAEEDKGRSSRVAMGSARSQPDICPSCVHSTHGTAVPNQETARCRVCDTHWLSLLGCHLSGEGAQTSSAAVGPFKEAGLPSERAPTPLACRPASGPEVQAQQLRAPQKVCDKGLVPTEGLRQGSGPRRRSVTRVWSE